jgi:predicted Zn-dependent protease
MSKLSKTAATRRDDQNELRFLQNISARLPEDTEVMRALADLYTRTGKAEEGLRIDEQLSQLCSEDPLVWYNLACSFALTKRSDDALDALARAIEVGYDDYEWMKKDHDLSSLRGEPRFESMLDWIYTTFVQAAD